MQRIPIFALIFLMASPLITGNVRAEDWKLNGGIGQRLPGNVLEVSGDGSDSNAWIGKPIELESGRSYRFSMEACSPTGGGGCAPCGLEGFSRDFSDIGKTWKLFSFIFKAPKDRKEFRPRVGQWQSTGIYRFRNIKIEPVEPIDRGVRTPGHSAGFYCLGDGEMIRGGRYRFNGSFSGPTANALRPFSSTTAGFNTDRFTVHGKQEIVFVFLLEILPESGKGAEDATVFCSANIRIDVNYHVRGECQVYASPIPGKGWGPQIGSIDKVGTISARVESEFLPSQLMFVRIVGSPDASFQVNGIGFEAELGNDFDKDFTAIGETVFADVLPQPEAVLKAVPEGYSSEPLFFDERRTLYVRHCNDSNKPVRPLVVNPPNRVPGRYQEAFYTLSEPFDAKKIELPPQSVCVETKPFVKAPEYRLNFSNKTLRYSFFHQPYRDADFGYLPLHEISDDKSSKSIDGIWWAESGWKISPEKAAPVRKESHFRDIEIFAAKNDTESFQLVVNGGKHGRKNLRLELDGALLRCEESEDAETPDEQPTIIPAANVDLRYVYYHFVERPTDATGLVGYWPDALPRLEKQVDIKPNRNQPFWISIYVPEEAEAGTYAGSLRLSWTENGEDCEQDVPFWIKVWDFSLPKRNTLETAYGSNARRAFAYHNVESEEDRRDLLERYRAILARHRIEVYDPAPLDPIRVDWDKDKLEAKLDFSAWDGEIQRMIDRYGISKFMLRIQGMGWGTYEERGLGRIAGFEDGSPESGVKYETLFADYAKKLESHLRDKGWLDMAYVYWFDEPEPKDYEFVAKGFARLQKHAPGLTRMITEEPNAAFIDALKKENTNIDIWCPVSYNFDEDEAKKRRQSNERFWWYVCCGPRAPYCTLFIDHAATELRVWHWQAWKYGVAGSLIWDTNYWTSHDDWQTAQNPYDDPMSYVALRQSGNRKGYWGNGDGRFLYPPLEAARPGLNEGRPVLKDPVPSIRLAMLREGVEDYEMLSLLRKLKEEHPEAADEIDALLIVPAEITSSLIEFTTDPRPLEQRRKRIAALIERLVQK